MESGEMARGLGAHHRSQCHGIAHATGHHVAVLELAGTLGPAERWGLLLACLVSAQFWGANFPSGEEDRGLVGLCRAWRLFLSRGWSWAAPLSYR